MDATAAMDKLFKVLCSQENDMIRPKTFTHFGRNISFAKTCGQVLDSTFAELCDRVTWSFIYKSKIYNFLFFLAALGSIGLPSNSAVLPHCTDTGYPAA